VFATDIAAIELAIVATDLSATAELAVLHLKLLWLQQICLHLSLLWILLIQR
jgi:hypothetical protein